jgi:hypothetical protein
MLAVAEVMPVGVVARSKRRRLQGRPQCPCRASRVWESDPARQVRGAPAARAPARDELRPAAARPALRSPAPLAAVAVDRHAYPDTATRALQPIRQATKRTDHVRYPIQHCTHTAQLDPAAAATPRVRLSGGKGRNARCRVDAMQPTAHVASGACGAEPLQRIARGAP